MALKKIFDLFGKDERVLRFQGIYIFVSGSDIHTFGNTL